MAWSTRCKLAVVVAASLVALAIVLIVVLTMDNGGAADSDQPWHKESRLPTTVLPSRYDILLHPFLDEGTFTGTVNIDIQLLEDRKYFVIHAKNLAITSTELQDTSGANIALNAPFEVPKHEWWVIQPAKGVIPQSSYVLKMEFSGQLTRNIVGFYRSSYNTSNGERRYLATSKFEPTYARLAFPCFDEPAMKASYKVRLVKPSAPEYIALSNSEQKSVVDGPGPNLQTVEFSETVKMSSYLSVFIVCDFVKQSEPNSTMKSNKPVNVYARREQIENAEEARSVALTTVDFYAEYFDIPYPMPKIDLIAIPDFVSGAMENWGLITFRETSILFDKNQNSPANQEAISETVAHELAHMWFGNLVTMKWWTDLWLNEGFATFMAQKGVGHMHPDWDYTNQFVVDTLLSVLKLDAELSSHPVLQVVSNPDQITEIFDTISYDKGSSVILMLEAFMGEENFKKGLNTYLNTHLYNNAETKDLWRALQDFAPLGVDVAKVMDTWTRQMGFPLVTVENTAPGKFKLTQKRFLSSRDAKFDPSESKYGYKWEIPIRFATSASKNNDLVWLPSEQESVSISVDSSIKWIKLNHNQRGYYRVNYNSVGWTELITTLKADIEEIDAVDRAGLISDVFSLADAEELEYDTALELSTYLSKERKYVPWDAASTAINSLLKRLPKSEALKKYGISLVTPIVDELSWTVTNRSDHLERRLRALVLDLACSLEDNAALSQANNLFTSWLTGGDGNKPDQDIRSVVYRYGFGNSNDSALWKQVFEKFQAETNTQEKLKLMYSLATTRNEDDLKTYLKYSKDQNVIRSQDFFTVLAYIADNPLGVQLVWDFYRDEYDYLVERFTLNDRIFGRFITRIAAKFDTEERLKEIKAFFDKHPDAGAGAAARKQALENVQNSIKWLTKHKGTVESWLQKAA